MIRMGLTERSAAKLLCCCSPATIGRMRCGIYHQPAHGAGLRRTGCRAV